MNFKEMIRFTYGLLMGTSTPFIKPTKRFLWPTTTLKINNNLSLFLGGSANSGVLTKGSGSKEALVINSNQGAAARQLCKYVAGLGIDCVTFINTSIFKEFSGGNSLYSNIDRVYVGQYPPAICQREWIEHPAQTVKVRDEQRFLFGDEEVIIVPVGPAASAGDLAVFLTKSRVLFLGGLFSNGIHPYLRPEGGMNIKNWILQVETLMERFHPEHIVPAEGEIATPEEVTEFVQYLKDLSDSDLEFQACRQRYDWVEIPGQTSLEENFDLLRRHVKSHTTLN